MRPARLARALAGVRRISLDTALFIAAADAADRRQACAAWLLDEIERGRFGCTISAVSAAELFAGALKRGLRKGLAGQAFLRQYPHLDVASVTIDIAADAAHIRLATNLKLPDCIITATALLHGAEAIVHADRAWARAAAHAHGTKFIYLADYCP